MELLSSHPCMAEVEVVEYLERPMPSDLFPT